MPTLLLSPRTARKVCLWVAPLALMTIRLATTSTPSLLAFLDDVAASASASTSISSSRTRSVPMLPPRMPRTVAQRPTADALAASPSTGLDPIAPFVLPADEVLEHLAYHRRRRRRTHLADGNHHHNNNNNNNNYADDTDEDEMKRLETTDPLVYFVTPTYYRATQMADLTRLAQTLMHDPRVYWVVVEDRVNCTVRVRALLERTGLPFAHLCHRTDLEARTANKFRGAGQRNRALEVVETLGLPGVVYFGDDDNSYDVRLFRQLRQTKRAAVSGVLSAVGMYERCLVNETTGKVQGFLSPWPGNRTYPLDMAGFAFHSHLLKEKRPRFQNDWPRGYLETNFLRQLVDAPDELEPLDNCTQMYAWHVKTQATLNVNQLRADPDRTRLIPSI